MLQTRTPICSQCRQPMTWGDESADNALKMGSSTKGLCRECRKNFWLALEEERKKKYEGN